MKLIVYSPLKAGLRIEVIKNRKEKYNFTLKIDVMSSSQLAQYSRNRPRTIRSLRGGRANKGLPRRYKIGKTSIVTANDLNSIIYQIQEVIRYQFYAKFENEDYLRNDLEKALSRYLESGNITRNTFKYYSIKALVPLPEAPRKPLRVRPKPTPNNEEPPTEEA
ncbi:hypothetical protein KMW28_05015 [Flammeovirga yaeyamensis]|uniref:Uncharacterized protein n=1 Tax=Flammeovirga yaeyamensis TaxID=367791 RepID=A0AAX1N6V1_9BACT|nr:hypothetical protein [Flammeovirga yaeyamensis]MBB3697517.1 hypothetical protein [Flammeovirga yaeyamensis]NMF36213.1 hypothetical protein [Flammeovirga yaeyamensis]QWG02942.1 hypothetical protein KMW28_05015 [Flammeovirga yaeyamensis]